MADRSLVTHRAVGDPAPVAQSARDAELEAYVRRNLVLAGTTLAVLVGLVGLVGVRFEKELYEVTQAVYDTVGIPGLAAILFLSDSVITPIPPDVLLVIVAKSDLRQSWVIVLLGMGVLSTVAGNTAWALGGRLGDVGLLRRVFGRLRERNEKLVARYGAIGVALGALTPIPFSVTCWAAGLLRLPARSVFWPTLLRIPRFFFYYWLIAYSDRLFRPFF
jgi:membrane protein YqaA with SNARE-associated domain